MQTRNQNRVFWRTAIAAFFTIAFPLITLVLFGLIFDFEIEVDGGIVDNPAQFYAPSLAVFAAASATFTNIGINLSTQRDDGILKRWRGTPIAPSAFMGGAIVSGLWIAVVANALMLTVGAVFYDVEVDAAKVPASVLAFVVGSTTFAALGVALSALVKSGRNAPAAAQAVLLPMAFVSDVFVSTANAPSLVQLIGDVLPLKPFVLSFGVAFNPFVDAPGFMWDRLAVVAAWGVAGAVVASRRFTWEPAGTSIGSATRGRSRRAVA
ncbi:MAG: ABC transporter permease [Acidimicrobiia bacterium]|nr:ABC transporter permease [Acidimicrobiia bacterium]